MGAHPNVQRAERFLDAYARGDRIALTELLADDIVWHVGGKHPYSGTYRGKEAVNEYFAKVTEETGGSLKLEPLEVLADDQRGALFLRVTGQRGDKSLDVVMAEAFTVDDEGRWTEYWALSNDQASVDAFWA